MRWRVPLQKQCRRSHRLSGPTQIWINALRIWTPRKGCRFQDGRRRTAKPARGPLGIAPSARVHFVSGRYVGRVLHYHYGRRAAAGRIGGVHCRPCIRCGAQHPSRPLAGNRSAGRWTHRWCGHGAHFCAAPRADVSVLGGARGFRLHGARGGGH